MGDKKEGIGIAVKIDSGNGQARNAVVVEVLRQLGIVYQEDLAVFADTHTPKMRNHKQEEVGSMRPRVHFAQGITNGIHIKRSGAVRLK